MASLEEFEWRVSIARVDGSADFSHYPGVQRQMAVLKGEARLLIDDEAPLLISPDTPPISFAGESRVRAEVIDGPLLDLNVMIRRQGCSAKLLRYDISGATPIAVRGHSVIAVATCELALRVSETVEGLTPFDGVALESEAAATVVADGSGGRLYVIELQKNSR
jgi:hypothetical protein